MNILLRLFGDDAFILKERNFELLLIASIFPVLGTSLISPILSSIMEPLTTSPENIGLMISFFTAPPLILIPILGVIADGIGRKPILVSGLVIFGFSGAAIALTTDYQTVLILRFLQGVGFAGVSPIIITAIGDFYSGSKEAAGQGLRMSIGGLSGTFFPILAGILVVHSWRHPFLLYSVSIPAAVIIYLYLEEPDVNREPSNDKNLIGSSFDVIRISLRRSMLPVLTARILPSAIWVGFITYNSIVIVRLLGESPAQAGLLVAMASLMIAGSASQVGRITIAAEGRLYPLILANIGLTIGFILVLIARNFWIASTGTILMGLSLGILISMYRSIITGLASKRFRGGLVGISEAGERGIQTVTPILMGSTIGYVSPLLGFEESLQIIGISIAGIVGSVGIVCVLIINRHHEI